MQRQVFSGALQLSSRQDFAMTNSFPSFCSGEVDLAPVNSSYEVELSRWDTKFRLTYDLVSALLYVSYSGSVASLSWMTVS